MSYTSPETTKIIQINSHLDAEQSILGAILIAGQHAHAFVTDLYMSLEAKHFYDPRNKLIFNTIIELWNQDSPIDIVSVEQRLKEQGDYTLSTDKERKDKVPDGYLLSLLTKSALVTNPMEMVKTLANYHAKREVVEIMGRGMDLASKDQLNAMDIIQKMDSVRNDLMFESVLDLFPTNDMVVEQYITKRKNDQIVITDIPIREFRTNYCTLNEGDVMAIGATEKTGKTQIALQIADYASQVHDVKSVFFSFEVTTHDIINRLIMTRVKNPLARPQHLKFFYSKHDLVKDEKLRKDIEAEFDKFAKSEKLKITDKHMPLEKIIATMRFMNAIGYKLFVFDQISHISSNKFKPTERYAEIDYIVKTLTEVTKSLGCATIIITQLNREVQKRERQIPKTSDLADSKALVRYAHKIFLLHKEVDDNEKTTGVINFNSINRDADQFIGYLNFDTNRAEFALDKTRPVS